MPLYAYRCTNCGHKFDVRQRFSDDPVTVCPRCGGEVRRIITQVGVVFKGSGFYVTDNRNGKATSKVNGSAKSSETTADSAGTDTHSSGSSGSDNEATSSSSAGATG